VEVIVQRNLSLSTLFIIALTGALFSLTAFAQCDILEPPKALNICRIADADKFVPRNILRNLTTCKRCSILSPDCCVPGVCLANPYCVVNSSVIDAVNTLVKRGEVYCDFREVSPKQFVNQIFNKTLDDLTQIESMIQAGIPLISAYTQSIRCAASPIPSDVKVRMRALISMAPQLNAINERDLAQVRIIAKRSTTGIELAAGQEAITLGDVIVLQNDNFDALMQQPFPSHHDLLGGYANRKSIRAISTLIHEMIHVKQFREMGETDFYVEYLAGVVAVGFDPVQSRLERPAYSYQRDMLKANGGHLCHAGGYTDWTPQPCPGSLRRLTTTRQTMDLFGKAIATGDFNGDGYVDLAVGAFLDREGGIEAGTVSIFRGTSVGIDRGRVDLLHAQAPNVPSNLFGDTFGTALATGDFNKDGYDDLAVGAPALTTEGDANNTHGMVLVFHGSENGLLQLGASAFWQGRNGMAGKPQSGDDFGSALTVGDFNGDTYPDLAIGAPLEDSEKYHTSADGVVSVIYGGSKGLAGEKSQLITQETPGIFSTPESGDQFGSSLAAGDFDGNGVDDLAIGHPFEDFPPEGLVDVGAVSILFGQRNQFLSGPNGMILRQGPPFGDRRESGDSFGWSLAAGNFDGNNADDLAVGVPREDLNGMDEGLVHVLNTFKFGIKTALVLRVWQSRMTVSEQLCLRRIWMRIAQTT
jgi:FG-GAP repeat